MQITLPAFMMQRHFIVLVVVFAWKVNAQTTDTVADVSGGEELQTEIASTAIPSTSAPETTSVVAEREETELASNSESGAKDEESTTEPEQSTQLGNEKATIQQENQNTEPGIETEDATPDSTNQQEPEAEERTTSAQPPPVPQEETTSPPALQEDVTPQPTPQEETSPQSTTQVTTMAVETTTMQAQMETEGIPEQGNANPGETISSQSPTTTTTPTPSTVEQTNAKEIPVDTSTEPARSAVEGGASTVMIETEGSNTDSGGGEGVNQPDGTINNDESACPSDCKTGTGDPICGSDQKVYESECHLKRDMCGKNVTAVSWELCRGKHDICPAQCLNIQDPVCGEDGKIYPNLCLMYKFNCGKRMRTYDLVRCVNTYRGFRRVDGACPKVCHDLYRPVCGSDGKVYSNDCYIRLQTCGRNVQIVEMSKCVDTPRCPHTCTPLYDPVCGSDGRMYLNHCYFANLNCGKNVAKVDLRYCESFQHLK